MPGKTLTEEYLGDAFVITMTRRRDPGLEGAEGALVWEMTVRWETRDGTEDEAVLSYARDDALEQLTPAQRTNATNFANMIVAQTATKTGVEPEKPAQAP